MLNGFLWCLMVFSSCHLCWLLIAGLLAPTFRRQHEIISVWTIQISEPGNKTRISPYLRTELYQLLSWLGWLLFPLELIRVKSWFFPPDSGQGLDLIFSAAKKKKVPTRSSEAHWGMLRAVCCVNYSREFTFQANKNVWIPTFLTIPSSTRPSVSWPEQLGHKPFMPLPSTSEAWFFPMLTTKDESSVTLSGNVVGDYHLRYIIQGMKMNEDVSCWAGSFDWWNLMMAGQIFRF